MSLEESLNAIKGIPTEKPDDITSSAVPRGSEDQDPNTLLGSVIGVVGGKYIVK